MHPSLQSIKARLSLLETEIDSRIKDGTFNIYIKQMKAKGKEKRIPKVVKQRVLSK